MPYNMQVVGAIVAMSVRLTAVVYCRYLQASSKNSKNSKATPSNANNCEVKGKFSLNRHSHRWLVKTNKIKIKYGFKGQF